MPPPLPVRNRQQHSEALNTDIVSVIGQVQAQRVSMGLDPSQMLIIEFTARLDSEVRKILEENLNLRILSEVATERPIPVPDFSVEAHAPNASRNKRIIATLDQTQLKIESIEPVRGSDGEEDQRKSRFIFATSLSAKFFKLFVERNPAMADFKVFEPVKRQRETFYKTLVQFSDSTSIEQLQRELAAYSANGPRVLLTAIQRATLFDALEYFHAVSPEDRLGINARENGFPNGEFYFDLDLWHTGEDADLEKSNARIAVEHAEGRVTDIKAVADMLILVRVLGNEATARKLLEYDRVSRLDLPPSLHQQLFDVLQQRVAAPPTPHFGEDMPKACVVDSGIMPSHPLMSGGLVASRDFDSGDNTTVDTMGHGTHVAGIVVYGDIVHSLQQNQWVPKVQVLNAKVLGMGGFGLPEFSDVKRAETQLEEAIRWAFEEHECRVFNLSLGNPASMYSRGHQLPWALMLDTLTRELDILIVVSAGNNTEVV